MTNIQAQLDQIQITPDSVTEVPGHPGVFEVRITIPEGLQAQQQRTACDQRRYG
jgi:hypothetical protein